MTRLLRLLNLIHTFGKYRLDILFGEEIPTRIKLLTLPLKIYPQPKLTRGQRIRYALEELGPVFIKFGQLLSTRPDLIPDDIAQELNHLQDNVTPFCTAEFKTIVERSLGGTVEEIFDSFSDEVLGSASVAQVQTARLKTGEEVVVKVIRPGIEKVIDKDIRLLAFFARLIEKFSVDGKRLRPVEVVEDYRSTIFDELDLQREAANASQIRRNFENSKLLYVPHVFWDYTTKNVMVMERIHGLPVTNAEALRKQNTNLKLLAERGVEVFFTQVFEHNFFHADMHPGNVFVSKVTPEDPGYMAVDMAIVGSLSREDQYYLARNLIAMFRRDYRQVAELHVLSGWVPPDTSISGFESAIRSVCEPIFEKPISEISFGQSLISLFQTARRFNMPVQPQLVLLQKTLVNIEGLGRQLYPDLNLWDTAHPYLENWIKKRYHPKTLWKEFKYHSPDWMEKFPKLPELIFTSLEGVQTFAKALPQIEEASIAIAKQKQAKKKSMIRKVAGIAMLAGSSALIIPQLTGLSIPATVLFVTSIALLTF